MQDAKRFTANALRVWMREVLEHKGWSANEWAVSANTSPTNITRLLNGTGNIPTCETLFKLAQVARSMPNFLAGEAGIEPKPVEFPNFCPECGHDLRPLIQPPDVSPSGTPRRAAGEGR